MAIQCGKFKRVLVAPSTIPEAGWGLFIAEEANVGELISVYAGELVSRMELSRVDLGQYSSAINSMQDVSGLMIGNKARFINDPLHTEGGSGEQANCIPQVIRANGNLHYAIFAAMRISPGEELFFSYGEEYWKEIARQTQSRDESP